MRRDRSMSYPVAPNMFGRDFPVEPSTVSQIPHSHSMVAGGLPLTS
jgi:hypothetical protein